MKIARANISEYPRDPLRIAHISRLPLQVNVANSEMADNVSATVRSRVMAATKGKGNRSTELILARVFRSLGITGWRRHHPLPGKPDFVFQKEKVAIFADGCFWHGCPQHVRLPQTNTEYWRRKIDRNRLRDREADRMLKLTGWAVFRFWEHQLKADPVGCAKRVRRRLAKTKTDAIPPEGKK